LQRRFELIESILHSCNLFVDIDDTASALSVGHDKFVAQFNEQSDTFLRESFKRKRVRQCLSRKDPQTVAAQTMPLGNVTGMTAEERELLGRWIREGARLR